MIDKTISHYRILEKLGEGAMGVVYLAEDPRLQRRVALKFLAAHLSRESEFKDRFVVEARAASALHHPNICAIYDIGETPDGNMFITMPAYEGKPLDTLLDDDGPLPIETSIDIIQQIAIGLGRAHDKNIIHRDIKPANIFITYDGRAVILDFGLAKLSGVLESKGPSDSDGTAAYRAPEQIRGEAVNARTDIWALGMVFYEMITGRRPFTGQYESAVSYQIMNQPPEPLNLPDEPLSDDVWVIIEKTLSKKPEDRYSSTSEFIDAFSIFKAVAVSGKTGIHDGNPDSRTDTVSIAVLPFRDMSPDKDQEYFCDGITEELIDGLSKVDGWRVVSRTSSFALRNSNLDSVEIGKRVNATHLVDGSLRKAGSRIRISANLVKVDDGFEMWSDKYNRELEDVFDIQDEIAHAIVENLKSELGKYEGKRIISKSTDSGDAHNLYLKGRFEMGRRSADSLTKSITLFEDAIALDPTFPLAYAGLADAYILRSFQGAVSPEQVMPNAIVAANRAIELDENLAEAYVSRGCAASVYEWDWEGAERLFTKALEINPNNATAHHWYATWVLMPQNRLEQAFVELYHGESLDPLSMIIQSGIGWQHYFDRRYEAAAVQLRQTLETFPESIVVMDLLGQTVLQLGRHDEAIKIMEHAVSRSSRRSLSLSSLGHALASVGRLDEAERILQELDSRLKTGYVSSFDIALVQTGLQEKEAALDSLEKAVEEKNGWLCFLAVDPRFDPLRSASRYADILIRIGLAQRRTSAPPAGPSLQSMTAPTIV